MLQRAKEIDESLDGVGVYDGGFSYGVISDEEPTKEQAIEFIKNHDDTDYAHKAIEVDLFDEELNYWHITALYPMQLEDLDSNEIVMLQCILDPIKATYPDNNIADMFFGHCKIADLNEGDNKRCGQWIALFQEFLVETALKSQVGIKYLSVAKNPHYRWTKHLKAAQ